MGRRSKFCGSSCEMSQGELEWVKRGGICESRRRRRKKKETKGKKGWWLGLWDYIIVTIGLDNGQHYTLYVYLYYQ